MAAWRRRPRPRWSPWARPWRCSPPSGSARCGTRPPVGAGDAFVAGYLAGVLDGAAGPGCLRMGVRCGAFAVTVAGDWEGLPTREELDLLAPGAGTVLR